MMNEIHAGELGGTEKTMKKLRVKIRQNVVSAFFPLILTACKYEKSAIGQDLDMIGILICFDGNI